MTILSEQRQAGAFLASEAEGSRSRENGTLASGDLPAGAVLALNGDDDYVQVAPDATDGTETAVAVLYAAVDASEAAADCVVIARDAEVNQDELVWPDGASEAQIDTGLDQLRAANIIPRSGL
ncbi:MAG: head decoration protein [Dichotomicrobium sp.]